MTTSFLYVLTVLIWGSTWLAIKLQLGIVPLDWSVAYRMALASVFLFLFCLTGRRRLRFGRWAHIRFAAIGFLMFSFNYVLMYAASRYMPSGLVAITFSTIVIFNIINGALIFKTPMEARVLLGALIGLVGICFVFWKELDHLTFADTTFLGLVLAFAGTLFASLGNMVSVSLHRAKLPVIQSTTWGTLYGTIMITASAIVQGQPIAFDWSAGYIFSLSYLALFGTVAGFYTYLTLLGRIGAERAAYTSVLFPVIALALSTFFEGYNWNGPAEIGVALVLFGNFLVLVQGRVKPATV